MQHQVEHQAEQQQFTVALGTEHALLQYSLDAAKQHVHFYSTYVPASARGKGVANQLVVAALSWAKQNSYHISNSCSYIQLFLDKQ